MRVVVDGVSYSAFAWLAVPYQCGDWRRHRGFGRENPAFERGQIVSTQRASSRAPVVASASLRHMPTRGEAESGVCVNTHIESYGIFQVPPLPCGQGCVPSRRVTCMTFARAKCLRPNAEKCLRVILTFVQHPRRIRCAWAGDCAAPPRGQNSDACARAVVPRAIHIKILVVWDGRASDI